MDKKRVREVLLGLLVCGAVFGLGIVYGQQAPYHGTPSAIPGKIECEDFDFGGEGVAYHDSDAVNDGGLYRSTEAVDITTCQDTGGGYNLSNNAIGEWLEYTVDVASAGIYTIELRATSEGLGGIVHIEFDGVDKTGDMQVPDTEQWQTWETTKMMGVSLDAGQQVMRLEFDTGGHVYWDTPGDFNYINVIFEEGPQDITVTSPNGGETWGIGTDATVKWTSELSVTEATIDLSTNGGTDWVTLVSTTARDGMEIITVPNSLSTECRIRVADGSVSDTSDANFTIEEVPAIAVNKTSLDFEEVDYGATKDMTFNITNTGGGTLNGSISGSPNWIKVSPASFNSNSVTVTVTVDNDVLQKKDGEHTGTVSVTSNGGSASVSVKVTATCVLVKPNPYDPTKGNLTFFGDGIVPGETTIRIYTLSGELVKTLGPEDRDVEQSEILLWRGTNEEGKPVSNGIYTYTYESPKEKGIGKITVIKQ